MNKLTVSLVSLLLILSCLTNGYTQTAARRRAVTNKTTSPSKPADNYWSGQRSIESALAALESFVNNSSSDDARSQTAVEQIQMLKEIRLVQNQNPWAMMVKNYLNRSEIQWRVSSVEVNSDYTKAHLEIRNANTESERCFKPLRDVSLIDNRGRFVPMLRVDGAPRNVRVENIDNRIGWCLAANQLVTTTLDFAPLAPGTTSGQISYREDTGTGTKPARFSLFQQNLR